MLSAIALSLALANFVTAQDPTTIDTNTIPTILPTVPTDNITNPATVPGTSTPTEPPLQTTTATIDGSVTIFACIAATDQIVSIQTDTILGNDPPPTPVCGAGVPTTSLTIRPPPVINSTVTASLNGTSLSTTATLTATESITTTGGASESGSTSASSTHSGNPAPTMAVAGGLVGVVGLAAGMAFL